MRLGSSLLKNLPFAGNGRLALSWTMLTTCRQELRRKLCEPRMPLAQLRCTAKMPSAT